MRSRVHVGATLASVMLGWVISAAAVAAPPADEAITTAVKVFADKANTIDRSDRASYVKQMEAAAREAMSGIDVAELSVAQIRQLQHGNVLNPARMNDQVAARLTTLAASKDKAGAAAAILRLSFLPPALVKREGATDEDRERAQQARKIQEAALWQVVGHPGLSAAVAGGSELFMAVGRVDGKVLATAGPQLMQIASLISPDLPAASIAQLSNFYGALSQAENIAPADRERVRVKIAEVMRGAQGKIADGNLSTAVTRSLEYVDGAYARGQLVGHPSPPLDFTWTNGGELKSIADLRGKVVVLDFWATWCGPCVASFPDVRELQAHYAGYPVVVLGITSLQGFHMDRPEGAKGAARRIDTKGKPDEEYELMNTFVRQLQMTWPVAFTSQDVFNPDYGIRGIPHVAILDPAGVVRYRGIHPAGDKAEKYRKIDGLLREFKLPAPANPG